MEHFARDSSLLCRWGRHNVTGLPPSRELVLAALKSRSQFGFLEVQQQLLYALADQFFFSKEGGETALGETKDEFAFANLSAGVALLQREHTVFPPYHLSTSSGSATGARDKNRPNSIFPSMHLLSHTHLVSYGGSYYAYLYAKLVASQLWNLHFKCDPLNPAAGALLSSSLLSHGASRDPRLLLNHTLGGQTLNARHFIENLL
jgi:Zn-dependent oligopeptidase